MRLLQLVLCCLVFSFVYSQEVTKIDVVTQKKAVNLIFALEDIEGLLSTNESNSCIEYNIVETVDEVSSEYYIDLYESEEFYTVFCFYYKFNKGKVDKQNKPLPVSGIRVRSMANVIGKLIETERSRYVDGFEYTRFKDKIIEDRQVGQKWSNDRVKKQKMEDAYLEKYDSKIEKHKSAHIKEYQIGILSAINNLVNSNLLPMVEIAEGVEIDGDKVKKVRLSGCESMFPKYNVGSPYSIVDVRAMSEANGITYYENLGTIYNNKKNIKFNDVMNVRGGKKQILAAMNEGKKVVVGYSKKQMRALQAEAEDKIYVDFLFQYPLINNLTPFDKKSFEISFQNYFSQFRNVEVITNNPVTLSIQKTFDGKKEEGDSLSVETIMESQSTKTIWVKVGQIKKVSQEMVRKSKATAGAHLKFEASLKVDGKEYKDEFAIFAASKDRTALSNSFEIKDIELSEIEKALFDDTYTFASVEKTEKDKAKFVLIKSDRLLRDGMDFKVYDTKTVNKKSKDIGKIEVETLYNRYTALAKVKKGDKKILKAVNAGKSISLKYDAGFFAITPQPHNLKRY